MRLITSIQELKKSRGKASYNSCELPVEDYLYVCLGSLLQVSGRQLYLDFDLTGGGVGALAHSCSSISILTFEQGLALHQALW